MGVLVRSLAALAPALCACASVTFDRQDVTLDRDPATDSLTIELVYHDVGAISNDLRQFELWGEPSEGPDVDGAADFVQAVAAGEPTFILLWPAWDLDLRLALEPGGDVTQSNADYLRKVRVAEAVVSEDDEGRLRVTQRIVFPDLSEGVEQVNETLRRFLLGEHQDASAARLTGPVARTYATALADARTGRDWLTWGDGGLVLRIPLDSQHLVDLLQGQADEWVRDFERYTAGGSRDSLGELTLVLAMLRELADCASDLRVDGDHLVLTLGDAEGDLSFTLGPDLDGLLGLEDFRPALREELERRGLALPSHYAVPE